MAARAIVPRLGEAIRVQEMKVLRFRRWRIAFSRHPRLIHVPRFWNAGVPFRRSDRVNLPEGTHASAGRVPRSCVELYHGRFTQADVNPR